MLPVHNNPQFTLCFPSRSIVTLINIYKGSVTTQQFIYIYNKIVYCQGNMFRPFIGPSSDPLDTQIQDLTAIFMHYGIPYAYSINL